MKSCKKNKMIKTEILNCYPVLKSQIFKEKNNKLIMKLEILQVINHKYYKLKIKFYRFIMLFLPLGHKWLNFLKNKNRRPQFQ